MSVSKFNAEDYKLEGTVLQGDTTTHSTGGSAATDQIGVWVQKSALGQGSFGCVFLQEHTATRALRAVKMLNRGTPKVIHREISSMLFLKNYRRLFVDFHAWYEVGFTYIAMEYVSGGDLQAYIATVGALEEGAAKGIAEQILQALFVLHDHGYMHCDLKPENIFIAGLSPVTIKVADLGQTKLFEGSYNTMSGTRAWAAPEQSTPNYNMAVDLWGAGCVVYFLLTSLNPFLAENDKSPIATVEKYTFPAWPRRHLHRFQAYSTHTFCGDRILVRGATDEANDFLSNMIVRSPSGRMSVYKALQHAWICDTTPLESALRQGDLPLSRLLAGHDQRYKQTWADPIPSPVLHLILRFAAAHGHLGLSTFVLIKIREWWAGGRDINYWQMEADWPNTSCPLIEAAKNGHLDIINNLLQCRWLPKRELSGDTLFEAMQAAVHAGHGDIQSVLLPLLEPAHFGTHEWCRLVAGYMDLTTLITTIEGYKKKSTTKSGLVRVDVDCFGYRVFFPTMLTAAMERGKIENIKHLLSDPPALQTLHKLGVEGEAARIGRLDVVQLLLESCTKELRTADYKPRWMLEIAAGKDHLEVVKYMLARGVLPHRVIIEKAALQKNRALVQLLLNALIQEKSPSSIALARECALLAIPSCNVRQLHWLDNLPSSFGPPNITGEVASRGIDISDAACAGDLEVVRYLLKNRQPYALPITLRTMALIGAIKGGRLRIMKYICAGGADLTAREPWRVAARKGQVPVLQLLLRYGRPLPGLMDQVLGSAAKAGHLDAVMLLLDNGALWNGPCGPVIGGVLAAFGHRGGALPEIGGPASRRN